MVYGIYISLGFQKGKLKKLFIYIFLALFNLQISSAADDIQNFQIEGISVGDSLLDYFSEDKINEKGEEVFPSSDKFLAVTFRNLPKFEIYDGMQFHYKKNDRKYIIQALNGQLYYNDIKECKKQYDEIVKEFSEVFSNAEKIDQGKREHQGLAKVGKKGNFYYRTVFRFESGYVAAVVCYDWTEETNMRDGLGVYLNNKEYLDFIENEAY